MLEQGRGPGALSDREVWTAAPAHHELLSPLGQGVPFPDAPPLLSSRLPIAHVGWFLAFLPPPPCLLASTMDWGQPEGPSAALAPTRGFPPVGRAAPSRGHQATPDPSE